MNDPILEALTFSLNSDLEVDNIMVASDNATSGSSSNWQNAHLQNQAVPRNSKSILPSSVILGEHHKTPCLIPGCPFLTEPVALKVNKDTYLGHLLTEHRMVIDDVDKIANLYKYVIYWKEKLESAPITDFCVGFQMDELPKPEERSRPGGSETELPVHKHSQPEKSMYYMLTYALPEDKELRSKIWNNRLEAILEVNRQEREQKDFSRQCLLCREVFTGNRTSLFQHMKSDHSFHIGKPDNIVFIEEFLELIADKLNKLICLYCEKTFKDKTVLRDHMRKKGHKRLNSDNSEFDRYYLVNYLEPGKDWKALEEEDPEDERIEEEWMEAHDEKSSIVCLFCTHQGSNFDDVLEHIKTEHKFDFLQTTFDCDFYQKVKIVNFIRRTVFLNTCLFCEKKFLERTSLIRHIADHEKNNSHSFPSSKMWNQPEYFFPTYENDQFLVFLDKDNAEEDDGSSVISNEEELLVIPEDPPQMNLCNFKSQNLGTGMDHS